MFKFSFFVFEHFFYSSANPIVMTHKQTVNTFFQTVKILWKTLWLQYASQSLADLRLAGLLASCQQDRLVVMLLARVSFELSRIIGLPYSDFWCHSFIAKCMEMLVVLGLVHGSCLKARKSDFVCFAQLVRW